MKSAKKKCKKKFILIKYDNVNKRNRIRLWNKIVLKTSDEQIESNWGPTSICTLLGT